MTDLEPLEVDRTALPAAVVDALEVVDVQEGDAHRALPPGALRECVVQAVDEQQPVRRSGERVMQRLVPQHLKSRF